MMNTDNQAFAWREISTHLHVYRDLILEKIKNAPPSGIDHDDKGYWEHELKALNHAIEVSKEKF